MNKLYSCILFVVMTIFLTCLPCEAKTLKGEVKLNWPLLSQEERAQTINYYRDLLFHNVEREINMEQFKDHMKDPSVRINRAALKKDLRNLGNRQLAGFYLFGKLLVIYGVKYMDDKYHIYYYDALGNLQYVDILSGPHNEFPHVAYQYNDDGKLKGISYYISEYDQYVFEENGDFKGRWYFEKMYDKKAKVVMTRKLP